MHLQSKIYRDTRDWSLATELPLMEMGYYEEATDVDILIEYSNGILTLSTIVDDQLEKKRCIDWEKDEAINDFYNRFILSPQP